MYWSSLWPGLESRTVSLTMKERVFAKRISKCKKEGFWFEKTTMWTSNKKRIGKKKKRQLYYSRCIRIHWQKITFKFKETKLTMPMIDSGLSFAPSKNLGIQLRNRTSLNLVEWSFELKNTEPTQKFSPLTTKNEESFLKSELFYLCRLKKQTLCAKFVGWKLKLRTIQRWMPVPVRDQLSMFISNA